MCDLSQFVPFVPPDSADCWPFDPSKTLHILSHLRHRCLQHKHFLPQFQSQTTFLTSRVRPCVSLRVALGNTNSLGDKVSSRFSHP